MTAADRATRDAAEFARRPQHEHIHTWFELSYSNYLVLNRTLLQSMPDGWQARFVALLDEMHDAFRQVEQAEGFQVQAGRWVYVYECTDAQLARAGVTSSDDDPDSQVEIDPPASWRIALGLALPWMKPERVTDFPDGYETTYYDDAGNELAHHDRVFVPSRDPVPRYNRGRAYIEPLITPDGDQPDA